MTAFVFPLLATIFIRNGFPVANVPLPSRQESCEFTLKPLSDTVNDFLYSIQEEDGGIERAAIYTLEGNRVAGATGIDILLQNDFDIVINETRYRVTVPLDGKSLGDTNR